MEILCVGQIEVFGLGSSEKKILSTLNVMITQMQ